MLSLKALLLMTSALVLTSALYQPKMLEDESELKNAGILLNETLAKIVGKCRIAYTVSQVHTVSEQKISSRLFRYEVELTDDKDTTKFCEVAIFEAHPMIININFGEIYQLHVTL